MLSHLRFHRRAPSNPSSPLPDQSSPWDSNAPDPPPALQDVSPHADGRPRSSNSSQLPPTLPPIARVASSGSEPSFDLRDQERPAVAAALLASEETTRSPPARPAYIGGNSGFIGGVALRNYEREIKGTQRQDPALNTVAKVPDNHITRAKPAPPPINTGISYRPAPVPAQGPGRPAKSTSFVTPTDLQQYSGVTGKRPAGTRLASEPVTLSTSTAAPEAQRAKKGLPFLKNPMSTLLMRRRAGQNATDYAPVQKPAEPAYDPRIRGTRVHDFSAPRPKKVLASPVIPDEEPNRSQVPSSTTEFPTRSSSFGPISESIDVSASIAREVSTSARSHEIPASSQVLAKDAPERRRLSLDKPLPEQPAVSDSSEEVTRAASAEPPSTATSRANSVAASAVLKSSPSTMTARSGRASTRASVMSALPRHMKSTSSRFSFDMIGAAKQEKLLEERHRQRQAEKQTSDPRDSTYDGFDEDFDYDAMMEDDGLEERIPGINADLDEEEYPEDYPEDYPEEDPQGGLEEDPEDLEDEVIPQTIIIEEDPEAAMDPDNDQENFAGFVFQRSNPTSSLTSPHTPGMMSTPRDASGRVIGFAMTKDTTPDLGTATSPVYLTDPHITAKLEDSVAGLGIHGLPDADHKLLYSGPGFPPQRFPPASIPRSAAAGGDDLYFDEGLADELDFEHDGEEFDESIFDNHDTDQYGRPIPGAFAQAQAERAAAKKETSRRESDMTSQVSAQSAVTQSTAHTSLSTAPQALLAIADKGAAPAEESVSPMHNPAPALSIDIPGQDLVYQAALAEAAQMAEAAGKFRRSSSPPLPADLTITSPTDSSGSQPNSHADNGLSFYEDDPYAEDNGLDDYDFDDEAIIAEANASALAFDSDGWYGQEFGFYAAPAQTSHHVQSSVSKALSAENLYQFGGFFSGGQGVNRSTSGRVVSREPNLTPITERSEYSNRNSIMSLIVPPGIGSEGRNSASLQSPGLAQLAMMADDDNMSLSALLKLRSRAWGGSQASLASSREGSPRSERPGGEGASSPWGPGPGFVAGTQVAGTHARKNSAFSLWSNSDAGSASGSPTLTMSVPLPVSSPPVPVPPMPANIPAQAVPNSMIPPPLFSPPLPPQPMASQATSSTSFPPVPEAEDEEEPTAAHNAASSEAPSMSGSGVWMTSPSAVESRDPGFSPVSPAVSSSSPVQQHPRRPGMGHRHKGSADSISYRKEEESGDWVMERRRTAESGEVEILKSEVVGGGRI
ncbi:hypothetical protein GQ53DRAFT_754499 [Thozetella sp. PMI_491]|nr:hypothetical protein GQ53DRAFT_754499 [Thozetella sp. PMI_491]